jgi:hypothetical protein
VSERTVEYRRSSTVLWRRCSQSVLLLPRGAAAPLALSGSGVELWHLLEQPQTLAATASYLAQCFDIDANEAETSIAPVLDQLVQVQAVESRPR